MKRILMWIDGHVLYGRWLWLSEQCFQWEMEDLALQILVDVFNSEALDEPREG